MVCTVLGVSCTDSRTFTAERDLKEGPLVYACISKLTGAVYYGDLKTNAETSRFSKACLLHDVTQ